ncbi:MAG: N-6 DNA methylase [Candidatus Symbiothrix sp.]|jgi:hypothetical protein|nr:N-6 DNA methylase [Candidatus Symbiothrix sp.]
MSAQESLMNRIQPELHEYLVYLQQHPDGEEIQYRTVLENLVNAIQLDGKSTVAIQEDHRSNVEVDGIPDFFVWENHNTLFKSLIGFIECKKPSYKLEKLIESEQIKKYANSRDNIIITNYFRFILLQKGKVVKDLTLDATKNKSPEMGMQCLDLLTLFITFYGYDYPYIKTKKELVNALASQSFYYSVALREYISNRENVEDLFYTKFCALYNDYENSLNYHYELADFCDIYSQSLVYGLLLARLESEEKFNEQDLNYLNHIPLEYKLLYEFLSQGYECRYLPTDIRIALTQIGKYLNLIDIEAVQKEFANSKDGKQNISVYLYEDFLAQYDKFRGTENRREGGVYYTPKEVADFIARSINEILKEDFKFVKGYNSEKVKVLDFACGTGTFLQSVFEQMLPQKMDDLQKITTKKKIINDIYGFELLVTPYIIAHTFLSIFLKNKGINLERHENLAIYLTNTLDISQHTISGLLPALKRENTEAMKVKDCENILAIVGNPPYFIGKSKEKVSVIDSELKKYKEALNEKNIQPLNDSYIKFIRFAEWKINNNKSGVIGIITNNSFLDGPIHRQMRKHLYETFDEIYILNLHGNARKGEPDKNIFDIMVGVQISIFVKLPKPAKEKKVFYFSTLENGLLKRSEKLSFLESNTYKKIKWEKLKPAETPYYWFVDKDLSSQKEYKKFWKLTNVFKEYSSGTTTAKDVQYISYKKFKTENNKNIAYRPFDNRFIDYDVKNIQRARYETMQHFIKGDNIGLCLTNGTFNKKQFNYAFISKNISEGSFFGFRSYLFPLYFYNGVEHKDMLPLEWEGEGMKFANFTDNFVKTYLDKLSFQPEPEEVLAYIYAILHSPVYREKYIEFLKTDFPAVPMTTDETVFRKYAALGQKLVDLHLLDFPSFQNLESLSNDIRVSFDFEGEFVPVKTETAANRLFITTSDGKTITIDGVTEAIYNFEIGSYKPIDKWLKYRIKDEVALGIADLNHLKQMIIAIKQTIAVMQEIEGLGEQYLTDNEG